MLPPLTLSEGGDPELVQLSAEESEALAQCGIASALRTRDQGWFEVAARKKIGAVMLGERQVIVRPKIADLNRLIFLIGYSPQRDIWRDDRVRLTESDDLLPALAEAYSRIATRTLERGVLQGYRSVREALPVVRGRLMAGEQMNRRFGLLVPVEVEYDDFTADIAENQLLLAAVLRLLRIPGISPGARRRLQRLRVTLVDVTVPTGGAILPTWTPSRLNARYDDALRLAAVVLAAESFEHHVGNLVVSGFMFDMWKIFEDFVTVALGEALERHGGRSRAQRKVHLDVAKAVVMKPDLLWFHDGVASAVVDAKYKAERPSGFPDADLYQMLAYCTALGLGEGHLVYAKGNEQPQAHLVRNAGVQIHCHALDLTLAPAELLVSVDQLAGQIARRLEGAAG